MDSDFSRQLVCRSIVANPKHPKHKRYCDFFRLLSVCHAVNISEIEDEEDGEKDDADEDHTEIDTSPMANAGASASLVVNDGNPSTPGDVSSSLVVNDGNPSTPGAQTQVQYAGMSPDEVALVQASSENGFTMTKREMVDGIDTIFVKQDGFEEEHQYQIEYEFEFDSDRKRQSVVAWCLEPNSKNKRRVLFTKGADNIMEELKKNL